MVANLETIGPDVLSQPLNNNFAALNNNKLEKSGDKMMGPLTMTAQNSNPNAYSQPIYMKYVDSGGIERSAYLQTHPTGKLIFRDGVNDGERTFWHSGNLPYETGTWTPELWFGSSNSGITYSMRTGRYTMIGNIVYFTFRLDLTSKGSESGVASITGLPFTSMSGNEHAAFAIGMLNPINMPSNAFWVHGIILNSSNQILIRASGNLEGSISLNASNFSDNTAIRAEGFYFIP